MAVKPAAKKGITRKVYDYFAGTDDETISNTEELRSWALTEGLTEKTVEVLLDNEFTSLEDLKELSQSDLAESFKDTKLLPMKQYTLLKKAVSKLTGESPTAPGPTNPSPGAGGAYCLEGEQDDLNATFSNLRVKDRAAFFAQQQTSTPPRRPFLKDSNDLNATFSNLRVKDRAAFFAQQQTSTPPRRPFLKDSRSMAEKPAAKKGITRKVFDYLVGTDDETIREEFRFIMLGKTGSGKSKTGNAIFGEEKFHSKLTFKSVTHECELARVDKAGKRIEIMDCPGLYDTDKTQQEVSTVIVQAVGCMHPGPHAVLFVVKLGRFTEEEFGVYTRLKALFDNDISKYLILLFTGGDELEKSGRKLADLLREAPHNLLQVLEECGHRCIVFNNHSTNPKPQVEKFFQMVQKIKNENGDRDYYTCPKYAVIGDGLEQEIGRRLETVMQKDQEREKYVRELEEKTQAIELKLEEFQRKFQEKEEERKRQSEEERLKLDQEKQRFEKEVLQKHQAKEAERIEIQKQEYLMQSRMDQFQKQFEEERRREQENLARIMEERDKMERERREEERAEAKRREKARQRELDKMKEGIAQNQEQEQGWVEWGVSQVAGGIKSWFGW